ncbi:hypothetical protein BC828DRAFT_380816 [Blastocladiella britannica]|nr:hypothetical protein BC828DRAFT_380816 [Blastocladiella britannica]
MSQSDLFFTSMMCSLDDDAAALFSADSSTTDGFSHEYDEHRSAELSATLEHVESWMFGEITTLGDHIASELASEAVLWKKRFPYFRVSGTVNTVNPPPHLDHLELDLKEPAPVSLFDWKRIETDLEWCLETTTNSPSSDNELAWLLIRIDSPQSELGYGSGSSLAPLVTHSRGTNATALPSAIPTGHFFLARRANRVYVYCPSTGGRASTAESSTSSHGTSATFVAQAQDIVMLLQQRKQWEALALWELESWDADDPLGTDAIAAIIWDPDQMDANIDVMHGTKAIDKPEGEGVDAGDHHQQQQRHSKRSLPHHRAHGSGDWTWDSASEIDDLDDLASPQEEEELESVWRGRVQWKPRDDGMGGDALRPISGAVYGTRAALPGLSRPGTATTSLSRTPGSLLPSSAAAAAANAAQLENSLAAVQLDGLISVRPAPLHAKQMGYTPPPPLGRPPSPLKRLAPAVASRPRTSLHGNHSTGAFGSSVAAPRAPPAYMSSYLSGASPNASGNGGHSLPSSSSAAARTAAWAGGVAAATGAFSSSGSGSRPSTANVRLVPLPGSNRGMRVSSATRPPYGSREALQSYFGPAVAPAAGPAQLVTTSWDLAIHNSEYGPPPPLLTASYQQQQQQQSSYGYRTVPSARSRSPGPYRGATSSGYGRTSPTAGPPSPPMQPRALYSAVPNRALVGTSGPGLMNMRPTSSAVRFTGVSSYSNTGGGGQAPLASSGGYMGQQQIQMQQQQIPMSDFHGAQAVAEIYSPAPQQQAVAHFSGGADAFGRIVSAKTGRRVPIFSGRRG